jgi:4-amino-4-deoxy-L-arabinose transferase-like glycosyltransferase
MNLSSSLFYTGSALLIFAVVFHAFKRDSYAIFSLVAAALCLYLYSAALDPFLNVWDERFHALVAKNMMKHPLRPTLYDDPVVNMAYDQWDRYHIWVHKQPLFMWQIALSFQIFGINEFSLRLPNALLCTSMVYACYRSGKLMGSVNAGFYAAVLMATSFYSMQLVSGAYGLDQNDAAFMAYVSLSLWAWIEYLQARKTFWLIVVGLLSGFAILCKWLPGLLVYLGWFVYVLKQDGWEWKKYKDIARAFLITSLVFIPWQLFILLKYPTEAAASYAFNRKHIFEALDGHTGNFLFHFLKMNELYGNLVLLLILPALYLFYLTATRKPIVISLLVDLISVYLFFSFVETKMNSFTIIAILPVFLALGFLIDFLAGLILRLRWMPVFIGRIILISSLLLMSYMRFDPDLVEDLHGISAHEYAEADLLSYNKDVFQKLKLPSNAVLFNVKGRHYIEAMFYTGLPAYNFIPSEGQCLDMYKKHRIIALFNPRDSVLPDYLANDKRLLLIRDTLRLCE